MAVATSAALRLVPAGRLSPSPATWRAPLPPALLGRVDEARRREHERLVKRWDELHAETVDLTEQLERQKAEDEKALRQAVTRGRKPPAAKAPALEERLAETRRAFDAAGSMLTESGSALVSTLADADLEAAITEADARSRQIVEDLPARVAALLDEMRRSGELNGEVAWIARLHEARRQQPWSGPRAVQGSHRLGQARESLTVAKGSLEEELIELDLRDHPVQHHPPSSGFAPPQGSWVSSVSSTELPHVVEPEGVAVERKPKPE